MPRRSFIWVTVAVEDFSSGLDERGAGAFDPPAFQQALGNINENGPRMDGEASAVTAR
jgi:hypothetical protein